MALFKNAKFYIFQIVIFLLRMHDLWHYWAIVCALIGKMFSKESSDNAESRWNIATFLTQLLHFFHLMTIYDALWILENFFAACYLL